MTTKTGKSRSPTVSYKKFLARELKDAEIAASYLTSAFNEGAKAFLLALKDVVEARGGIGSLAKTADLNREGLYTMLSKNGNPRLSSLAAIMDTLGLRITFSAKD